MGTRPIAVPGGGRVMQGLPPMRYSPLLPVRRPMFGRRKPDEMLIEPAEPTSEERRLIDRIIRHAGMSKGR